MVAVEEMFAESVATRKLTILPQKKQSIEPIYQHLFQGYDVDKVYFKENPQNFNLDRAKKNPLFVGTVANYRQGDVLLKRIDEVPENLVLANTTILAESILTGNTHEFLYGNIQILQDFNSKEVYLEVKDTIAILGHKESQTDRIAHKAHVIEPGYYHLKFQQTFVDNRPIRVID